MSALELRTPRLLLRQWREDDLEPLVALNADPEVQEHLSMVPDRDSTAAFIESSRRHFEEHGFGRFAVEAKTGELAGRLLGFCGVGHPTFVPECSERPELGYRLGRFAWGHGYATEAALAARDDAFERCRLPELISLIDPRNERSLRVAVKCGFELAGSAPNPITGLDLDVWARGQPLT